MSLAVLIPAALALAVYAGLALSEAARLSAGDTRTLIATAAAMAHLLKTGDAVNGARYPEKARTVDVRRCVTAASAARGGGRTDLSRSLLERGEPDLARQWRAASCPEGDPGACGEMDRRPENPEGAAAQAASWISVVYAGRTAGAASIRANAALIKPTDKPRVFSLLGVWRYDVTSGAWRRLVTPKLQRQVEIPPQRRVRSQESDQVLYALPRDAGLYWVEWQEDARRSSALAFSGPILCNDVTIGEAPGGMIATCVPFTDRATAMFVPDPRVATGTAVTSLVATTDGGDDGSRAARGMPVSALPKALLAHLEKRGVRLLERASDDGTGRTIWVLADAPAGARCEVFTTFVRFPPGVDAAAARRYLLGVSRPAVLNERERLAMFHPAARGTTSNRADCERWGAERTRIVTMLVEAFESYVPAP